VVLETFHISEKSMTLRAFDKGPVRSTGSVGQTKGATMRAGSMVVFDVAVAHVTIITVIFVFCHGRHGKYGIVMLVVV
jgi:hypothetical protein